MPPGDISKECRFAAAGGRRVASKTLLRPQIADIHVALDAQRVLIDGELAETRAQLTDELEHIEASFFAAEKDRVREK